jgi:predicted transposase YbfD/YdcC
MHHDCHLQFFIAIRQQKAMQLTDLRYILKLKSNTKQLICIRENINNIVHFRNIHIDKHAETNSDAKSLQMLDS